MHFYTLGHHAPLGGKRALHSEEQIIRGMFNGNNMLCTIEKGKYKYLAGSAIFRGKDIDINYIERNMSLISSNCSQLAYFTEWLPDNLQYSINTHIPPLKGSLMSGTLIANSTSIIGLFSRKD